VLCFRLLAFYLLNSKTFIAFKNFWAYIMSLLLRYWYYILMIFLIVLFNCPVQCHMVLEQLKV